MHVVCSEMLLCLGNSYSDNHLLSTQSSLAILFYTGPSSVKPRDSCGKELSVDLHLNLSGANNHAAFILLHVFMPKYMDFLHCDWLICINKWLNVVDSELLFHVFNQKRFVLCEYLYIC